MKFNFKKIASVIASTVMLSSTVALAAAANYPSPFVKSGVADVAVVFGAAAAQSDMTAAVDITNNLNSKLIAGTSPTTVEGGDFVQLAKTTNLFNLGEDFRDIYTTLDDEQLSTVLKSTTYEDDEGTEYDYDQKLTLGGLEMEHFADDDVNEDEVPVIGFDLSTSQNILNYTLDFVDSVENSSDLLETTYLEMLGRKYYISDWVVSSLKMTLLDTANTATVYEDEPVTLNVGGVSYEVSLMAVNDESGDTNDDAILVVNGEELDSTIKGNSRKIAEDTYISILDLQEAERESDRHWVKFSIGSGQIILDDGETLEVNEESVDDITVDFTVSNNEISQIDLVWTNEDDEFIVPGSELLLPGFETIKLSMASFIRPELEDISVTYNGDDYVEVSGLDLKDGSITLPLLYTNASASGFKGIGKDITHLLTTSSSTNVRLLLNETANTRFAATWINGDDWESSVFEVVSINEVDSGVKNETKIKNLANDDEITFTQTDLIGDDKTIGELTFTVNTTSGDGETAYVTITADSGTPYADRIVTKAGLQFMLPVDSVTATPTAPLINLTANPTTWIMNFSEGDEDNNVADGADFSVTLGHTASDGPHVSDISPTELAVTSGSDNKEAYVTGANSHATKLLYKTGGDQDEVDISYAGKEAYGEVYISEALASVISTEGGAKVLPIKDSEVASVSANNLIVVGGSCINTEAARLLGGGLCGADFESATGVGAGSFLIQTFANGADGVATLVAGYNAEDTSNAAKYLTTQTVDTTVGKKYKGTTSSSAELVVA